MTHRHGGQTAGTDRQAHLGQAAPQGLVQRGHAVVVEARGHGAEDRHLFGRRGPGFLVALELLGHIAQRVGRTLAVELVDGHELGEIQHVDLLELAGGTELGRHDIHGHVHQRHDGRIALADARGLDHDQVEAGGLADGNHVGQGGGNFRAEIARGQTAHEDTGPFAPGPDRVHADAVTQQGSAALAPARVNGDQGHAQLVTLIEAQAADQFVGEARFAGTARAGDAQHGHAGLQGRFTRGVHQRGIGLAVFQRGDELGQGAPVEFAMTLDRCQCVRRVGAQVLVAQHDHLADHAGQAHALTIFGAVDAAHAIGLQFTDLGRHDHAAAAAEYPDVGAAAAFQQIDHVLEVFDVATLVGADGNALGVLLQGGGDDFVDAAVVPEVDHFGAHAHQDAPHDVDGGVMTVKQAGRGDEAHLVAGTVGGQGLVFGGQVGHGYLRVGLNDDRLF